MIPAISTLRSAESGCGAGAVALLRGVGVLAAVDVLEREGCEVLFLARLGAREVVVLFLLAVDFFVLLVVVLRAIAILLTFHCSTNYSMRAWGLRLLRMRCEGENLSRFVFLTCTIKQNCYNLHIIDTFYLATPPSLYNYP